MYNYSIDGGFQVMGVPQKTHPSHSTLLVLRPMVLGIPHFKNPLYGEYGEYGWGCVLMHRKLMFFNGGLKQPSWWFDGEFVWEDDGDTKTVLWEHGHLMVLTNNIYNMSESI